MTEKLIIGVDWKSVGLAVGIVIGLIFASFLLWGIISFLFGTNLGRFIIGVVLFVLMLWAILTDEVDDD